MISPESGGTRPEIIFKTVVLPQPEGPRRARAFPFFNSKEMEISFSVKCFFMFLSCKNAFSFSIGFSYKNFLQGLSNPEKSFFKFLFPVKRKQSRL